MTTTREQEWTTDGATIAEDLSIAFDMDDGDVTKIRDMIDGKVDPVDVSEAAEDYARQSYSEPDRESLIMVAVNAILGGHGVESASPSVDSDHDSLSVSYINMGDTYDTTLLMGVGPGFSGCSLGFAVDCLGDVLETMQNDEDHENIDANAPDADDDPGGRELWLDVYYAETGHHGERGLAVSEAGDAVAPLDDMVTGYIETALWSTTAGDVDSTPLDDLLDPEDLPTEWTAQAREDCGNFLTSVYSAIRQAGTMAEREKMAKQLKSAIGDAGQFGHDFWLTREGHGAGYWDGDYPEPLAALLTCEAKNAGNGCDDLTSAVIGLDALSGLMYEQP